MFRAGVDPRKMIFVLLPIKGKRVGVPKNLVWQRQKVVAAFSEYPVHSVMVRKTEWCGCYKAMEHKHIRRRRAKSN
jgi:hypothetical protein